MKKDMKSHRGVFEKDRGSGIWWIRYADVTGKIRREKVGARSAAIELVEKRRTEVRLRLKLPERFRAKPILFSEIAEDARKGEEQDRRWSFAKTNR
jgi:hypothetical protein